MRLRPGDTVPSVAATTIHGKAVRVPDREARFVHLQFRRFAGCPVCNFHLRTLSVRSAEIAAQDIHEIVFFHSGRDEMLRYQAELPFDCVADRTKTFYRQFGVENGILGLPADFLVGPDGRPVVCHYGTHAYDNCPSRQRSAARCAVRWWRRPRGDATPRRGCRESSPRPRCRPARRG